jgi:hypothetical protein
MESVRPWRGQERSENTQEAVKLSLYSALSASTGFTAAREAGRKLASATAAARMRGTAAKLSGSKGLTPNNNVLIKRETAAPRPMAMPIPVRAKAERTNHRGGERQSLPKIGYGKRFQKYAADDADDRGVGADADCQREEHADGEARRLSQSAKSELHVGKNRLKPGPLPDLAAPFLEKGEVPKGAKGGLSSFGPRNSLDA